MTVKKPYNLFARAAELPLELQHKLRRNQISIRWTVRSPVFRFHQPSHPLHLTAYRTDQDPATLMGIRPLSDLFDLTQISLVELKHIGELTR